MRSVAVSCSILRRPSTAVWALAGCPASRMPHNATMADRAYRALPMAKSPDQPRACLAQFRRRAHSPHARRASDILDEVADALEVRERSRDQKRPEVNATSSLSRLRRRFALAGGLAIDGRRFCSRIGLGGCFGGGLRCPLLGAGLLHRTIASAGAFGLLLRRRLRDGLLGSALGGFVD